MGFCQICNSHNCLHVMQGQQQLGSQQYENYLRQAMGMQNMQQQQTRAYVPSEKEEKKPNKLLLLLR